MAKRTNIILKKKYAIYAIDIYLVIERAVVPNEVPTTLASVPRDEYLAVTRNDKEWKKIWAELNRKKLKSSAQNAWILSKFLAKYPDLPVSPDLGAAPAPAGGGAAAGWAEREAAVRARVSRLARAAAGQRVTLAVTRAGGGAGGRREGGGEPGHDVVGVRVEQYQHGAGGRRQQRRQCLHTENIIYVLDLIDLAIAELSR